VIGKPEIISIAKIGDRLPNLETHHWMAVDLPCSFEVE